MCAIASQTGEPAEQIIDWLCDGGLAQMVLAAVAPKDATDTARLAWVANAWGGQRPDFAQHVLVRGGTGDLSDIRTFVDAAQPARTIVMQEVVDNSSGERVMRPMTDARHAAAELALAAGHIVDANKMVDASGVPPGEWGGLSPKQAWWAGYRVGKGLPPDMRRVDAVDAPSAPAPIDMILYCPKCGAQHVDKPEGQFIPGFTAAESVEWCKAHGLWENPPHKSHLCHGCKHVWRPADVPTNGVAAIKTVGKNDSPVSAPADKAAPPTELLREAIEALEKLKTSHWEHWPWPDIHLADAVIAKLREQLGEQG